MYDKRKATERDGAGRFLVKQPRGQAYPDKRVKSSEPRQLAIRSLLETAHASVDDKLTTVKTAHYIDKDQFQCAFRKLMGTTKS